MKTVSADQIPKRYVIHQEGDARFVYAQPTGEKIIVLPPRGAPPPAHSGSHPRQTAR